MSRLDNLRRLTDEGDFTDEQRQVLRRVGEVFNFHTEQIINTVNGNLDYDNIRSGIATFDITVDSSGLPLAKTQFRSVEGATGSTVVSALNQTNSAIYPESGPFVTFVSNGGGIYEVKHVTGLQSGQKYRLKLEMKIE